MKTYKAFLEEIDQFYTVGSIIEINMNDYLFKENEILYNQAAVDGYITVFWSERTGKVMMKILRMPNVIKEDLAEMYFN